MPAHDLSAEHVIEAPIGVPDDAVLRLQEGAVSLVGRMRNASNGTFLVRLDRPPPDVDGAATTTDASSEAPPWGLAIYKPLRGERPLWDFEPGLYRREVAAYRLSEVTGLGVVPPTVVRDDAPLGEGSLQWFVNADFSHHYFSIAEERPDLHGQLRAIAAFDVMVNNTDRKGGHCLLELAATGSGGADRIWAIDNGLCFAESFKLRTVIWEFAGEPLPTPLLAAARRVADGVAGELSDLLTGSEIAAIERRAGQLVDLGVFPFDQSDHGYPWPLL